jgi:HEAT repeat protein
MPNATFSSQIADLRRQYDAGDASQQRERARDLWFLCLGKQAATRAALPWLKSLATHPDERVVAYATELLGRGGPKGRAMARRLLAHERAVVRCKAAYGLAEGIDTSPATLKLLLRMAQSRSEDERGAAFHSLGRIAKHCERPALLAPYQARILALFDDSSSTVQSWATDALVGSFKSSQRFVEFALERLDPPHGKPQHVLLSTLVDELAEVKTAAYLPRILRIVRANPTWISWFLGPLSSAGPDAADIVPLLEPLAEGESLDALRAGGALLRIDGRRDVLRKLAKQIARSPDEVAGVLCEIGAAAAPVAGALARVIDARFDEPDWDLMWALTDALAAIESAEPVAVKALRKALSHESGRVQGSALHGLAKLGPAARAALPDLRKLARKSGRASRQQVERVIRAIEKPAN